MIRQLRHSVTAVLDDGRRISLRDYHLLREAEIFAAKVRVMNLWPGHTFLLEIVPFEVGYDED